MNPERLDFVMPPFTRRCWVSEAAKARWQPSVERLVQCTRVLEWQTVAAGLREAAIVDVRPGEARELRAAANQAGLSFRQLPPQPMLAPRMRSPAIIGRSQAWTQVIDAWERSRAQRVFVGLGAPPCCAEAGASWRAEGWRDFTWPSMRADADGPSPGPLNRLLACLGIYALPFSPCGPNCDAALQLAQEWLALARSRGCQEDLEDLQELEAMLDWPMTWTALHGIAEVRTPVLKLCADTDATGRMLELSRSGRGAPAEAGTGTRFPYAVPDRYRITHAKAWRQGLDNPLTVIQ